jgi:hypothetical protein
MGGPLPSLRVSTAHPGPLTGSAKDRRVSLTALGALTAGAALTLVLSSGIAGLLYALMYLVAVAPGLPLGWALFGRQHAAGWIAGALLGYATAQIALWLPLFLHRPSAVAFLAAWCLAAVIQLGVGSRIRDPLVALPVWSSADTRALVLVALLAPALMLAPYRNVGAFDAEGNRYYRAYFTADFFWHTALAAELAKYSMPPRNPYLAPRPMNYYWTYFLFPAVLAQNGPAPVRDVQAALKANAICSAILLFAALFVLVRVAVASPWTAAAAATLGVVAPSAEGALVLQQLLATGGALSSVTNMNIDAITAWQFQGLRIDNLARSIWYNPQHSTACALGLMASVVAACGLARSAAAAFLAGTTLALATCLNPFVGGLFSLIYGTAMAWHTVADGGGVRLLLVNAFAAVPVVIAVAWCAGNQMMGGAGAAVTFGFTGFARNAPIVTLLLSLGPVLIPALVGAWPFARFDPRPARVAVAGVAIGLSVLYLVTLSEASWIGFRAGQILLLLLPVLLARTLEALARPRRMLATAIAVLILVVGLPTTVIDVYNAQDIGNRRIGPGFRWTLWVTPGQQEAFEWIQRNTAITSIVQMEPIVRGREHWSLIPTFAQRRMAAGLPISLLPTPEYTHKSEEVRRIFATPDTREAWSAARRLRLDYIYLDALDRSAYPEGVKKFQNAGGMFERVFDNGEATVLAVQ